MKHLTLCLLLLWPLWAVAQEQEDDTTFQIARVRTLQEVLIKAEEPAWIREKLKLFIQKREENYQQESCFSEYDFFFQDTGSDLQRGSQRTVTDSLTAYRFQSQGLLLSPSIAQMKQDSVFQVAPEQNTVFGTDTACVSQPDSAYVRWDYLNEMLYQNLIRSLDKHFLRPTSRKAQFPDLIDIYPPKSVEIVNSKSRRYQMRQRLSKVPRQYVLLKE